MEEKIYNLTNPQKSIWVTEQYYKGTAINTICGYVYISDKTNLDVLKQAINEMVKSNDSMRLKVKEENNSCVQYLDEFKPFDIDTIELSSEDEMKKKALEMASTPFFEVNKPLFQFILFKLPNDFGGFIVNVHHLIGDSWSLGLIAKEVTRIYSELLSKTYEPQELPSYFSYIEAENNYKDSDKYLKDKAYWEEVFKTIPEVASISSIKLDQNNTISCEGKRGTFNLSQEDLSEIKTFCDSNKISVYNFFMAVYSLYVSRVSNLDDFVMGTPILNRTNFDQKRTMGMFISVAPLRIGINNDASFIDFARKIATDTMSLFRHQKYSYQSILEDVRKRDSSIPNLYNVVLSYQITKTVEEGTEVNYSTDWIFNGNSSDELQIHLFDLNDENSMTVAYDYKASKFDEQEISNLHDRILTMIHQIIANENISLKEIEIVTPEEKRKILYDFNNTTLAYPRDKTIVDLFEEQVEKTPDNIAVVFEDRKLTYKELNEKSNKLARHLVEMNIPQASTIGILLKRSIDIYICIFAILKSNHNYMLIDHNLPNDRINYMLENSNSTTIITSSTINKNIAINNVVLIDKTNFNHECDNLKIEYNSTSPACIIYTSGSTGIPKGVALTHRGIVNVFISHEHILHTDKLHNFLSMSTVSFDMFAVETYIALLSGGTIILTNEEEQQSPQKLQDLIINHNIDFILTTPSKIELLIMDEKKNCLKNVRSIQLGGEIFTPTLYKKLRKLTDADIYNGYGPTEITACCSMKKLTNSNISIGTPLCNTKIFICDKTLNLLPIGVIGELCVSGDGLSLGYINNEELTKKSFVKSNFSDKLLYKTGDLAYLNSYGELIYVRRNDNQVKLRGLRIELNEISSRIKEISGVKNSIVIIKEVNGNKSICAYISTSESNKLNQSDVKDYLRNYLPDYMIPTFVVFLDELPLTINGKVDTKKLPDIKIDESQITRASSELEIQLENICKQYLTCDFIDINTSLFDMGGDSLFAIKLVAEIYNKFNVNISVRDIFEHSTIKDLSNYITTNSKNNSVKNIIPNANLSTYYPLSSAQRRIYYASNMSNNSVLYNTAGGIIVDKTLDVDLLKQCFQTLIDRHEVLRTHFDIVDNDVVQIIDDKIDFTLSVDSKTLNDLDKIYAEFLKPFDLSKAPLFRAKVVNLEDNKMLLLLDMHHIISDGTSLSILLQELCDLYNGNSLPKKQVDYKDFTLWEKEQFESEEFKQAKDFWVNQFKDEIPLLNMPYTYDRPSVQSFEGSNYHTKLSKDVFEKVNEVSKKLGITPYMLMLSTYYILLSKYTSQDDIVVGTPIVGRELPELSNMLGMFVNTLALKNKVNHSDSFNEFSKSIKEYCLNAFQNQIYPFDELVKELNIKRDTSRNSLFDVMFIYQNNGYPEINLKNTTAEYFIPNSNISKFDLSLEIIPVNNELSLRFEYCTKLFDEDFIKRLSSHYINILNTILENTDVKIADIDMISEEERHQILYEFNDTKVDYPRDKTIVDLFEEQVEKTPDNIAVVFEDQKLTYKELNEKANQLARYLVENDVSNDDIVCLLLDKSLESIVSIMATLKVGASYLPIDVNYPSDRIDYIIKDSKSKILLTTKNHIHKSNSTIHAICVELDTAIFSQYDTKNINCKNILPDSLAYIMYTSGSTGNPKGVMVNHINIVRLIKNTNYIKFNKNERILQTGSIVFDACTFEIFGSLLNGFELYIIKKEELLDSSLLQDYLIKNKITILWLTAPLFNQLCEENPHMFNTVRVLLTGGDVLSPKHINMVRSANPNLTVINGYGPTENTTFSCCFTVDKKYTKSIPIGSPISNSTAYVVSPLGKLCPIGVPGELWVGGDGVAKGYLNNEALTNEKFIKNPFGEGVLYKTGDLVKWLPNGTIDFIGRIDSQVKIRGFRVELGEITSKISAFPSMKECVTVVNNIRGEKTICSYIVSDKQIDIQELRQYLKRNLPVYMMPTYFMQLEKLPINTNGKVDKNSLPTNFNSSAIKHKIKEPTNENEKILLDIFRKLLSFDDIGIDDDFFDLGGDSLLAIKLQVEAISNNLQINYADIFEHPTVEDLAKYIDHNEDTYTEKDFDYEKYDAILQKNKITPNMKIQNTPIGNVLLTGFTGFLGAHVLDSFIKKETGTIYCLIRGKNNMSPQERLENVLHFYFGTSYDKFIGNRIKLVEGDITLPDFGLNIINYNMLGTDVNTVIHCAALVKHYGSYKEFESINILGTKRVIDFSKTFDLKLLHVSTISVSGNNLAEGSNIDNHFDQDMLFNETNFYIGQDLKNFYVRSKFEAEKLVLDAILGGLHGCILRMGNLTSRFSEGKFQQNHFENAFVNRFKSFIQLGCIPDYLLSGYCEFTPIDFCGDAIIDIANHMSKDYTVFHLLNEKHLNIDKLLDMLKNLGISIQLVDDNKFRDIIIKCLNSENRKDEIEGIINDLDNNKKIVYKSDVTIDSTFSKEFLKKIGFEWPYIDINYIRNYFKYLTDIGYFNLNIN